MNFLRPTERKADLVPCIQFIVKTKSPFEHRRNAGDDLRQTAVPPLEGLSHLADLTLNLICTWRKVIGSDQDEIEFGASFEGIKHAVLIGPHPQGATLYCAELCDSVIVQGKKVGRLQRRSIRQVTRFTRRRRVT